MGKRECLIVGVVGCGKISDIYLKNMTEKFPVLKVKSCCAVHPEHARKKAQQYKITACTYEEMLADPQIDMVVILTPAPTHASLIRQALAAGKHVYTEKPIALTVEEAAELSALAEESGFRWTTGCPMRRTAGASDRLKWRRRFSPAVRAGRIRPWPSMCWTSFAPWRGAPKRAEGLW